MSMVTALAGYAKRKPKECSRFVGMKFRCKSAFERSKKMPKIVRDEFHGAWSIESVDIRVCDWERFQIETRE
jgi:hypothetical protein